MRDGKLLQAITTSDCHADLRNDTEPQRLKVAKTGSGQSILVRQDETKSGRRFLVSEPHPALGDRDAGAPLLQKTAFSLNFSCVCPEPVWVKPSF